MSRPYRIGRRHWMAYTLLIAPLVLGGCDSTREALGLTKKSPDEFAVATQAPLVLPPEFGLRPPEPGAPRPQEVKPRDRAQQALGLRNPGGRLTSSANAPASPLPGASAGEMALLQQAHAVNVDPDIRRKVNNDFTQLAERDSSFVDRLIFWQKPEEPGVAVDPVKEAQRLRENAAMGKAPNVGEVPTIKRKERGPLEGLF
ncbi:MAG TPA: DUF3035 domain-containing protein [Ferrovibrio sp.]|uniref:DUF3035 domain-containing protein n=1 Tax=Ferrovibrio sp. TaxID=1917215 RepID=UPI002ED0C0B8